MEKQLMGWGFCFVGFLAFLTLVQNLIEGGFQQNHLIAFSLLACWFACGGYLLWSGLQARKNDRLLARGARIGQDGTINFCQKVLFVLSKRDHLISTSQLSILIGLSFEEVHETLQQLLRQKKCIRQIGEGGIYFYQKIKSSNL